MFWLDILPVVIGPLAALFLLDYMHRVRPARKHREAEAAKPVPERREPRDMSRPYPCPAGTGKEDERLLTCPVCGMRDELFLDGGPDQGDLLGWPAHRTCVEWLGNWRPRTLDGLKPAAFPARAPMPLSREWAMDRTVEEVRAYTEAVAVGMITMNELRERIVGVFGYPEMSLVVAAADTGSVTCNCGMCFNGTAADLDKSMEAHRVSGQHEQVMAYSLMRGITPGAQRTVHCSRCGADIPCGQRLASAALRDHEQESQCGVPR